MAENNENGENVKSAGKVVKQVMKFTFKPLIIIIIIAVSFVLIAAGGIETLRLKDVKNSSNSSTSSSSSSSSSSASSDDSSEEDSEDDSDDLDNYAYYNPKDYAASFSIDTETGTIGPSEEFSIETMWEEDERYSEYIDGTYINGEYKEGIEIFEHLMNAEVVTQYPYIDGMDEDSFNGTVEFYRYIDDEEVRLTWISSSEFDSMVSSGNEDVLNYFTLNDDGTIKIAYLEESSYTIETDDPDWVTSLPTVDTELSEEATALCESGDKTSSTTTIETKNIDFKSELESYVLPFNLLWSIIVMAHSDQDEAIALAYAIAEIEYSGEISLIIDDNNIQTTDVTTYTYTLTDHYYGEIGATVIETVKTSTSTSTETTYHTDQGDISDTTEGTPRTSSTTHNYEQESKVLDDEQFDEGTYTTTYTEWHSENTVALKKKKIVSWCAIFESDATYTKNTSSNESSPNESTLDDSEEVTKKEYSFVTSDDVDALIADGVDKAFEEGEETVSDWKNAIENNEDYQAHSVTTTSDPTTTEGEDSDVTRTTTTTKTYTYTFKYSGEAEMKQNYTDIGTSAYQITQSSSYGGGTVSSPSFNEEIVEIFQMDEYSEVVRTICDTDEDSWFMLALEINDDTVDLMDLVKYIFNEVNGDEQEYDFETIWNSLYSSYSSIYGGTSGLSGNQGIIFDYLLSKGFSAQGCAGIVANMNAESGCQPNNLENSSEHKLGYGTRRI